VARHSRDNWLGQFCVVNKLSNLLGCLVPVHNGHVAVHEYKIITTKLALVLLNVFHHLIKGFLAIFGRIDEMIIFETNRVLEYYFQSLDIKALVIYHQYLLNLVFFHYFNFWL
jgi:hypothetical protein